MLCLLLEGGAPSSDFAPSSVLVVRPGAPSASLFLLVRPGAPIVASLLLVALPGAPSR